VIAEGEESRGEGVKQQINLLLHFSTPSLIALTSSSGSIGFAR